MRASAKRKTTANVERAKKRRERNRSLRRQNEIEEADHLGITVPELRQKKFAEVRKIMEREIARANIGAIRNPYALRRI